MAPAHHPGAGSVRRSRHLRRLMIAIATFFAALLFLLYSEMGLRWSVSLLTDLLEPLSVEEVHGRLAGPLTLSGIEYAAPQHSLSLEQLTLDWQPSMLLALTAHIKVLHAKGMRFTQQQQETEPKEPTEKFTLPQIGFPLKVIIDDARLDDIALSLPDRAEPLTVTQVALQAETSLNTLQVHTLQLHSDWLTLGVTGNLRPRQNYQTALELEWSVPQQNKRPWQGKGTLRGDINNLQLQQRLASPFIATLDMEGKDLLDALSWNGTLEIPQLESSQLPFPVSPVFSLGGMLTANGDLETFNATTRFTGRVETVGEIEGSAEATYRDQQVQLTRLLLTRQGEPAQIEASGEIDLATPLRYRMQAQWQELTWPLKDPSIISESGRIDASGKDKSYQFNGDFLLSGAQIPPGQWRVQGNGDEKTVNVSFLEGKLLDGTVSGKASLDLVPHLRWQGRLQGEALNPGGMWPQWPGKIAFITEVRGLLDNKGMRMSISLPSLTGTLRGRTLEGHSEADIVADIVSIKKVEVQVGSARLQAKGRLSDKLAFDWQLQAADLEDLLPQARGSLTANGNLTGPLKTPKFTLQIDGHKLGFAAYHSEQIQADIALDLQQQLPTSLDLQIDQLQLPGFPLQSISLKGRGPLKDHRITLDSHNARQNLSAGLTVAYAEGGLEGRFNRLQIDDTQLGQWKLTRAADFSITAQTMHLDELCLSQEEAGLCSRGNWVRDSHLSAGLRSARFPLRLLGPYLPQRFAISGELEGEASLDLLPKGPPRLEANLTIGPGRFELANPDTGDTDLSLEYSGALMRASTSAAGMFDNKLTLSLTERDRITITIQSSLARGWPVQPMQHPLKGQLNASIGELGFITSIIPEVQNFHGKLDVDVMVTGTLNSPRLSGHVRLDEGQLAIPRLGLELSELHLDATGNNSRKMEINGGVRSGDGELALSGQLAPTESGAWGVELALSGKNFEVARIPEARMQISPDLKASIIGREIHLKGEIDIPTARLEPPDISLAVKPSDDVIIIREDEEEIKHERWLIHTRIRMTATESIRFIGYGFDGRIGGDLLLIDEPGSVTRARGELQVVPGSTYTTFGTKLSTEYGRLNFADSPLDNPNLDIRASRRIGEVIAGVNVSGTAKKPILTLYSEPPMDQADILSYLTLGHPMSTAGQKEGSALAGAANTAGLIGGNYLAGYIGRQFGLEEARVEADPTTQSPWVVMGTYLSPRLYVRYGVGVYEDAYSVIVRYQLTEHWQLQGEGGRNSGADILYTFERP